MKTSWVFGIAGLGFLILAYLTTLKGDFASAGVMAVMGIVFAAGAIR